MYVKNPKAYDLDYDGQCAPKKGVYGKTFSVGIFMWIPKKGIKGYLKRSKVIKRIKGFSSNPEKVYKEAEEWIKSHDLNRNVFI